MDDADARPGAQRRWYLAQEGQQQLLVITATADRLWRTSISQ